MKKGVQVKRPVEELKLHGRVLGLVTFDGGVEALLLDVAPGAEGVDVDLDSHEHGLGGEEGETADRGSEGIVTGCMSTWWTKWKTGAGS